MDSNLIKIMLRKQKSRNEPWLTQPAKCTQFC